MDAIDETPTIALLLGDRNGIGPEIVTRVLAGEDARCAAVRILLVGDPDVLACGERQSGAAPPCRQIGGLRDLAGTSAGYAPFFLARKSCAADEPIGTGRVSVAAGGEVLDQLAFLLDGVGQGHIDGIVHAPFNKPAMKQAGLERDVIDFVTERLGYDGVTGELSVLDELWTSRVSSHVPLRDVPGLITEDRILDIVRLTDRTLKAAGHTRPRLAVAGLNPHAGDGGVLGDEEIRIIGPAVERAAREQMDVSGPLPVDSVFVAAKDGRYDAVIAMYHDQSQLALKLLGFGHGVTLFGGLPVPITTVMHGTGYDIVGQGKAVCAGFRKAIELCRTIAVAA